MLSGWVAVFDVGKTLAKFSLWDEQGRLVTRRQRYNMRVALDGRLWLDVEGIESWAQEVLAEFARLGPVRAIVPVGHGAAAAVIKRGALACPVSDYEDAIPTPLRAAYDGLRDSFAKTGSPALPNGLNLGAQLYRLEHERPGLLSDDACILPWPQYWAWRLCGVAASEVSSLGCHTDLWCPEGACPSDLARSRGWATRLAPLRRAEEVLGTLRAEWVRHTKLAADVEVLCGVHDSNAALLAAMAYPEIEGRKATVITTGTWFVCMRLPGANARRDLARLPESRDCLVNVDVAGRPVPSARFMGGREIELLGGLEGVDSANVLQTLPQVLERGCAVLPSWMPGVGPFPHSPGRWLDKPLELAARLGAIGLYAALMVDTSLNLIGASERLVIEGRFASSEVFARALATLRPDTSVFINRTGEGGVPYGALRLIEPTILPPVPLVHVSPLELDLSRYKSRWRDAASSEARAP